MNEPTDPPDVPADSDVSRTDQELEDIVADFLFRKEEGEEPTVEEFLARHPRHAEELALLLDDASGGLGLSTRRESSPASLQGQLGPWRLLEEIGRGGGGTVYRARHDRERHVVALKVLAPGASPRDLERFARESRVLRALDLVSVVPVLSVGEDQGRPWIAMKWIDGSTLEELAIQVAGGSAEPRAQRLRGPEDQARFFARLARTFAAVHQQGVLHRDVKPRNILVDRLGEPAIIDFGIARAPDLGELTLTGDGPLGTPRYLAPELLTPGAEASPLTDVYGLGLCLYEFATGVRAFVQQNRTDLFTQIRQGDLLLPHRAQTALPPDFSAIIQRATAPRPHHRHPSMEALADDLERFARGDDLLPQTRAYARPWRRMLARNRTAVSVAAGLMVVLLVWWIHGNRAAHHRRELVEQVSAWFLAPPDVGPLGDAGLNGAAEELLGLDPSPRERLMAAWIPLGAGKWESARTFLGPSQAQESAAVTLLRDWLDLRLTEDPNTTSVPGGAMSLHPGLINPAGQGVGERFDVKDVTSEGEWSREAEALRRRLLTPAPEAAEPVFQKTRGSDDPLVIGLRGALRYLSVPAFLSQQDAPDVLKPVLSDLMQVRDAEALGYWPRYLLASLILQHGKAAEARPVLQGLSREAPRIPEFAYLWAISLWRGQEGALDDGLRDQVMTAFRQAADGLAVRRGRRQVIAGGSAFEDQLARKVYGSWALFALEAQRPRDGQDALDAWERDLGEAHWHDLVFRSLLAARVSADLGDGVAARSFLATARRAAPDLALSVREEARLLEREGDEVQASRVLRSAGDIQRFPRQAPASLEQWLRAGWYGTRPYGPAGAMATVVFRPAPNGR